jgi:hypothetical protein
MTSYKKGSHPELVSGPHRIGFPDEVHLANGVLKQVRHDSGVKGDGHPPSDSQLRSFLNSFLYSHKHHHFAIPHKPNNAPRIATERITDQLLILSQEVLFSIRFLNFLPGLQVPP